MPVSSSVSLYRAFPSSFLVLPERRTSATLSLFLDIMVYCKHSRNSCRAVGKGRQWWWCGSPFTSPPPRPSPRRGGKKHTSGNFSTQYSPEIHPYFTLFLCVILFCFKVASLPFLVLRSPPPLMLSVKKKTSSGNYSPCYSPGVVATQGYIRLQCLS